MPVDQSELIAIQRSAAMLSSGQSTPVDRDVLYELCSELIEARQLLARLGTDLRSVAARAPKPAR